MELSDHGESFRVKKNSGYGQKTCSNRWRVCFETLDIVNTVLSSKPQWLMSTWILTEKLSKITAQARKIIRK
jgi:hypothetical protein